MPEVVDVLLTLVDERPGIPRERCGTLSLAAPSITVRELIQARIELEIETATDLATQRSDTVRRRAAQWLVVPDAIEARLNGTARTYGPGCPTPRRPDAAVMTGVALEAFERGDVLVLVDDRQVTGLDEQIPLAAATEVAFLRLVPLQGG